MTQHGSGLEQQRARSPKPDIPVAGGRKGRRSGARRKGVRHPRRLPSDTSMLTPMPAEEWTPVGAALEALRKVEQDIEMIEDPEKRAVVKLAFVNTVARVAFMAKGEKERIEEEKVSATDVAALILGE